MYKNEAIIADDYQGHKAVICPSCARPFIFSELVNKVNGRDCPHCEMYHHNSEPKPELQSLLTQLGRTPPLKGSS